MNIGLHGGLTEEKHRAAMGHAIWLYMWLIKRQTRRNGLVLGGAPLTYERIQGETHYAIKTMKRWMAQLRAGGYIEVFYLNFKMMRITILKSKKFGFKQLSLPMEQGPDVAHKKKSTQGPDVALTTPVWAPKVAPRHPKSGPSKQSGTLRSNETPEDPISPHATMRELGVSPALWYQYQRVRQTLHRPIAKGTEGLIFKQLQEFQAAGESPPAILEQAIRTSSWKLYPVLNGDRSHESFADKRSRKSATAIERVLDRFEKAPSHPERALPPADK